MSIEDEPPNVTEAGEPLVGISKWEWKKAVLSSGITLRPAEEIVEGETLDTRGAK